ncbi:MAG: alpha-L-glutamate ligase-like protein [Alphaproteobacteria bacterium]|nr:alpha-L-glutamate ligase-like protein [Alphaproteobacteria bacterium]
MFGLAKRLNAAGVVGINRRNADYTLAYNKRKNYPLVDDKVKTKKLAQDAGLAVPDLYGLLETQSDVARIGQILEQHEEYVIKPAQGSGGDGILVLSRGPRGYYRRASGTLMSEDELSYHLSNALGGSFSLGGQPDRVLIEYRVNFDPVFQKIAFQGVPDIRIIVFLGVPVMAMVRLPTRMSDGKANLHQGAIGAGVDIGSGQTLTAVWRNSIVSEHPDTLNPVSGVQIPQWETLLDLAARSYELTELGYQGIDIVLDKDRGPLILELNARPGLNIQIANNAGLRHRLELVQHNIDHLDTPEDRINFSKAHFSVSG